VYTFWVLNLGVGEILYQFIGQVVAARILIGPRGSEPRQWSHLMMLGRAMITNLGVVAFNATVWPLIRGFYVFAQVHPSEVEERCGFCPTMGCCIGAMYAPFHRISVRICRWLDRVLATPSPRGALYSAMFGIPREAGSRRIAETDAKYFTALMGINCYIDYLVAYIGLLLAVSCASAGWGYGAKFDEVSAHLWCAFGGFATFGFCNVVRMLLLGITDATFISYFENPEALLLVDRVTEERIRFEYEAGVRRKVQLTVHRHTSGRYAPVVD
jgi:hypothetical protein